MTGDVTLYSPFEAAERPASEQPASDGFRGPRTDAGKPFQGRPQIAPETAEVLCALNHNRSLQRAAFAGQPFAVTFDAPEPGQGRLRFPEALILSLIDQGLLVALQQAAAWPARNIPARPFHVRLSKEGEQERRRLLTGITTAANDDAPLPDRAA